MIAPPVEAAAHNYDKVLESLGDRTLTASQVADRMGRTRQWVGERLVAAYMAGKVGYSDVFYHRAGGWCRLWQKVWSE